LSPARAWRLAVVARLVRTLSMNLNFMENHMTKELSWRTTIDKVLGATSTPLYYNDMTERIIADRIAH